tara:strand:- start:32913 stop:35567 length:2655 start_codon:yes stop_codon:yes gene_type:complete
MFTSRLLCLLLLLAPVVVAEEKTSPVSLSQDEVFLVADLDSQSPVRRVDLEIAEGAFHWVTRVDVPWLEVVPASGRGSKTLTLRVQPGMLEPGQYQARLSVRVARFPAKVQSLAINYTLHPSRGVTVHSGDAQLGVINNVLEKPFVAQVLDTAGRPLSGVEVTFRTEVGLAEPASTVVVSDEQGLAQFQPELLRYGALQVSASAAIDADLPAYFSAVVTGWVSTLAGDGIQAYGGDDGPANHAHFNAPFGMAFLDGDLIVVDYFNHALRGIDLDTRTVYPIAGNGKQGFNGDGLPAAKAVLNGPFGIALNPQGDIIFSDYYNNRIRVIQGATGAAVTIGGNGIAGYRGDGGPARKAMIDVPLDIAADTKGNVYLSDWHHHVVRKLEASSGKIHTIAGTGVAGYTGEGPAAQAGLYTPLGLSFDDQDNLYIADYGNNRVRRIDAVTGVISTVAGTGQRGFSGDGELAIFARLNRPYNVYADHKGGLFVSDAGNHRVRHVDLVSGVITTVAGNGNFGFSAEPALAARTDFQGPFSVISDDEQNLYVAEYFGHRVRQIGAAYPEVAPAEDRGTRLLRQARQVFGALPQEALSDSNELTPQKIDLGRRLFHEPRLSRDGSISCSSCHPLDRYGMDGLPLAVGIDDLIGTRNTPTVLNAALQDSQFWDGRAATVESQVGEPLLHPREMAMPDNESVVAVLRGLPSYRQAFAEAFPTEVEPVNFENVSSALGAFQRRLLTPGAALDRYLAGERDALSAEQLTGLEVFLREGCGSCHAGPLLGGQDIHLIEGYPNVRGGDQFEFRKRLGNTHKFKVAPLRNIARTAPYLHDGRYAQLEDALGERLLAYMVREAGIRDTVELAEGERGALIAFLDALTGRVDEGYTRLRDNP